MLFLCRNCIWHPSKPPEGVYTILLFGVESNKFQSLIGGNTVNIELFLELEKTPVGLEKLLWLVALKFWFEVIFTWVCARKNFTKWHTTDNRILLKLPQVVYMIRLTIVQQNLLLRKNFEQKIMFDPSGKGHRSYFWIFLHRVIQLLYFNVHWSHFHVTPCY